MPEESAAMDVELARRIGCASGEIESAVPEPR